MGESKEPIEDVVDHFDDDALKNLERDRKKDRKTDRQVNREKDRETETETKRERNRERFTNHTFSTHSKPSPSTKQHIPVSRQHAQEDKTL